MVIIRGTTVKHSRRMLKKGDLLTRPTLARQDAPFPQQGPSNSRYLSLGEGPRLPFTMRIELYTALLSSPFGGGLDGLLLRVSNEGLRRPRVARARETIYVCPRHTWPPPPAGGLFQHPAKPAPLLRRHHPMKGRGLPLALGDFLVHFIEPAARTAKDLPDQRFRLARTFDGPLADIFQQHVPFEPLRRLHGQRSHLASAPS